MSNGDDVPVYEEQMNQSYTQFSRFDRIMPPYIWAEFLGVAPQKRRAFLLQNQYLTPLTFEYTLFTFFMRYCSMCIACALAIVVWITVGRQNPILYWCLVGCFGLAYYGYQWSVSRNTQTVREEVLYNSFVNTLACLFAVWTVFDLKSLLSMIPL